MQKSIDAIRTELEERLRFESLLTDISARFVNLPAEKIDDAIKDAQRRICELLDLDRSVLWQILDKGSGKILISHIHQPPGSLLPVSPFDACDYFPWTIKQILRGKMLKIGSLKDLPTEAGRDRETLISLGVKASIVLPLSIAGQVVGALSFGRLQEETMWHERFVKRLQLIALIFANVLAFKQTECIQKSLLQFEALLAEISARFIHLPADRIDAEIEDAQRLICECLGLDLSSLWQWSDVTPPALVLTHLHTSPEGPIRPERIDVQEAFPWVLQKLQSGDLLVRNTEKLPLEAAHDQETLRNYGVKSSVVLRLSAGGGPLIGILSFDDLHEERIWPEPILRKLKMVAQVFANALVRKCAELELRESEKRLNMATSAAGVGLWDMEIDSGQVWATPNTREMFHFAEDETLNVEAFLKVIHTMDRERVDRALRKSIQTGETLRVEYRIVLPDGGIRWINAGGQRFLGSNGKPLRLMGVSIDISESRQMKDHLQFQLAEIENLKQKLEKENVYLREEIELQKVHEEIIGRSQAMIKILTRVEQVARTDATVLIEGETGTGKELLARSVHQLSDRKDRPMVTVNCASLPPTLIESELFGREKGAYTGAMTRMMGRFEAADGATLFLDEIGELPIDVQAKLLRVLEQGRFERLGSTQSLQVDVRIIAATNQDLEGQVAAGRFRKDLFYRLNVFPILLPPLRERPDDIPPLVWTFVRQFEKKMGRRVDHITRKCMEALQRYPWPGNIRELKNVIERAMIECSGRTLVVQPPSRSFVENPKNLNLEESERRHILDVLHQTGWRLSGQGGAAGILGIKRTTLQSKMKKLGIRRSAQ